MIVRIFRAVIFDDKVAEFRKFLIGTALPFMRKQKGLVSITPCLPRAETPNEFCLVMVWETVDALAAFAGEDWRKPHVLPEEEGIVKERFLHHYDLAQEAA
ncbi:antibiotic biosynthesis monooxygenase [Ruegeria sediminis]|uniref:Antibiotic biosynthesis monooxygenase n=1 Tax=Ruegeria sediminis TaxID=2583820 RepID=A0ABY2WZS2_9RHOB|nr:antibiotic biosynthesis monooxygenase [Ruegeria sediminis]TMV08032.1 antibiotic biosynthesis monooxygenase [Ruegeria sediminis]